eukprot:Clim_evm31s241 gene=Clim_evmTU31s241
MLRFRALRLGFGQRNRPIASNLLRQYHATPTLLLPRGRPGDGSDQPSSGNSQNVNTVSSRGGRRKGRNARPGTEPLIMFSAESEALNSSEPTKPTNATVAEEGTDDDVAAEAMRKLAMKDPAAALKMIQKHGNMSFAEARKTLDVFVHGEAAVSATQDPLEETRQKPKKPKEPKLHIGMPELPNFHELCRLDPKSAARFVAEEFRVNSSVAKGVVDNILQEQGHPRFFGTTEQDVEEGLEQQSLSSPTDLRRIARERLVARKYEADDARRLSREEREDITGADSSMNETIEGEVMPRSFDQQRKTSDRLKAWAEEQKTSTEKSMVHQETPEELAKLTSERLDQMRPAREKGKPIYLRHGHPWAHDVQMRVPATVDVVDPETGRGYKLPRSVELEERYIQHFGTKLSRVEEDTRQRIANAEELMVALERDARSTTNNPLLSHEQAKTLNSLPPLGHEENNTATEDGNLALGAMEDGTDGDRDIDVDTLEPIDLEDGNSVEPAGVAHRNMDVWDMLQQLRQDPSLYEQVALPAATAQESLRELRRFAQLTFKGDRGRHALSTVELPKPLANNLLSILGNTPPSKGSVLRDDTMKLRDFLMNRGGKIGQPVKIDGRVKKLLSQGVYTVNYGPRESIAYAVGMLAPVYAATLCVLKEIASRDPDFMPRSILDIGSGTGTALWALREIWGQHLRRGSSRITAVDTSSPMLSLSQQLFTVDADEDARLYEESFAEKGQVGNDASPPVRSNGMEPSGSHPLLQNGGDSAVRPQNSEQATQYELWAGSTQTRVPALPNVLFREYLPLGNPGDQDLVIAAYTLSELASDEQRDELFLELWSRTKDYLVIVELGDHKGSDITLRARDLLVGLEGTSMEGHVVGPCPHMHACPLALSGQGLSRQMERRRSTRSAHKADAKHEAAFGHLVGSGKTVGGRKAGGDDGGSEWSDGDDNDANDADAERRWQEAQRLQREEEAKLAEEAEQDAMLDSTMRRKICFRTQKVRPIAPQVLSRKVKAQSHVEDKFCYMIFKKGKPTDHKQMNQDQGMLWPRMIFDPIKRGGHMHMDVCMPTGAWQRLTLTKGKFDRIVYRDAKSRKSGDRLPPPEVLRREYWNWRDRMIEDEIELDRAQKSAAESTHEDTNSTSAGSDVDGAVSESPTDKGDDSTRYWDRRRPARPSERIHRDRGRHKPGQKHDFEHFHSTLDHE